MSVDTTRHQLQDYLDALSTRQDVAPFLTDDVVWTTAETGERIVGRRAVADHVADLHTRTFDARPEVRASASSDDHAFLEADFVGTHTGPLGDLPATGVRVRVPCCVVCDLTDRGICALRFYMSSAALRAQLGVA